MHRPEKSERAMKRVGRTVALVAVLALAPLVATAGETGAKVGGVVEESAKTGGHAIRDGFLTFGRTVRAFFTGGGRAAQETWHENAASTRENAREGGSRIEGEANR
jgi:hypothetical protein